MATQMHTNTRLATFIARGNMGPAQIQIPELVPAQAAVQQPAAAQAPAAPVPGGSGPAHPQGGGGPPAPGGGPPGGGPPVPGGGGPPAPGGGGQAAPPPAGNAHTPRMCGNPPKIFNGDQQKADRFISQLKRYYLANHRVPEYNLWICKVVIACTFIQGALIDSWVERIVEWLERLNPPGDDIRDVWEQFLYEFLEQFQDMQKGECVSPS